MSGDGPVRSDTSGGSGGPARRCRHCGDVIGAYEPIVLARDATVAVRTSRLAAEPGLLGTGDLYHAACWAQASS